MNGNGDGVYYDYAQAWQDAPLDSGDVATVLPPSWMSASPEVEAQSGGSFFGDLWKGVADFSGSVLKTAAPVIGQAGGTLLGRAILGDSGPRFGPGQPALVGPRAPLGYPGIGGGGGGFLPGFGGAPSGGGSFLSSPASLAAIALGLVVVVLMVRR